MRQKEADHCNGSVIQRNNDAPITTTKMTTTTTTSLNKDSFSDNQSKETTNATDDSNAQTNYENNKTDAFAMVRTGNGK